MELPSSRHAHVVVVSPSGRIGHDNAEAFRAGLQPHLDRCAEGKDAIVLDLSGLEYISSAGLRVLMLAARQAKAQKGALSVAALTPVVTEIFQISRFDLVLDRFETVAAALASTSPAAASEFREES